ncbi:endonuclease [Hymenobacter sp. BT635]|uniref:Endonuclease n=1 Tax=Hymenobacter nitidus TaxID=2880929 RepID=A0ABS8ADV0_9BACT|nr:endonuclease [Hymenobacter nitidus]MCB2377892.1 endonuclease [Hymenobacter nitidus]
MKHLFAWALAAAMSLSMAATAQVMPAAPPANLQGQQLKDWLRTNWYDGKRVDLGYDVARGKMYNYIDVFNGQLTCVYSGYSVPKTIDSTATNTSNVGLINCEHTIPQSWFNEVSRMKSDIHHLFPTYTQWNSNRGSDMFADIADNQTQIWMRGTVGQSTIPTTNIDEWSEDTNTAFEPREDHKGNVARCAFYFYTMHEGQAFDAGKDVITGLADLQTLYRWHLADPVDARERERNRRTAKSQGNFNPFIAYPELVARAYNLTVQPIFGFSTPSGTILEGNSGTTAYTTTVTVTPAPTSTLTVQVAVDAASTATATEDYTFATQTLTFAAGETSKTVTVTVNGDTKPEANETLLLTLTNPSTGSSTGSSFSHSLVITNDDGQAPTVAFSAATGALTEGNTGSQTYTLNVTLTGTAPTSAVTVPITVDAASTAVAADYTLNTTSVTFAAGQTNQTQPITITVVGDLTPEASETVVLRLGTLTGGAVAGTPATHTFTITNDDQAPTAGPCTRLYFSEYVEAATGNTKVLEIFNPSPFGVDLTGKRVALYANGATANPTIQNLTGSIAPGDVYVIANAGSAPAVLALADLTSNVTFFNGDDAIALFDGTDTLDVIGVIGQRPATTGWVIPGGGTTTDNTLVRRAAVTGGSTRWATGAATWQALGTDVYTNIGSHTSNCLTLGTKAAVITNKLEVYPTPTTHLLHVRLPELATRTQATISLYNALGQQVLTQKHTLGGTAAEATLDVHSLPAGLYTVRVATGEAFYTSRAVVQP